MVIKFFIKFSGTKFYENPSNDPRIRKEVQKELKRSAVMLQSNLKWKEKKYVSRRKKVKENWLEDVPYIAEFSKH
jgi:hypothetical protein